MARADAAIGIVEGSAATKTGYGPDDYGYGASIEASILSPFGKGSSGRRMLIIWGASAVWLFLVWRAVEGY